MLRFPDDAVLLTDESKEFKELIYFIGTVLHRKYNIKLMKSKQRLFCAAEMSKNKRLM